MLLTAADLREWIGRPAMDPYGEPLGEVAALLADSCSGVPEWLLLTDPSAQQGHLVPVTGAVPTGRQIRVVPTAEQVRDAPAVRAGEDIDPETKARVAAHYGLRLHRDAPPGLLSDPAGGQAKPAPPAPAAPRPSREVIAGLRAAQAMEEASLKLLSTMGRRDRDEELMHDIVLHRKATSGHAERVCARLDELGAGRGRPVETLAKLAASIEAQRGRLRRMPASADVEAAMRFELAEAKGYRELCRVARRAGDQDTARLADEILADEIAMAMTLRNFRLRSDPGFRRATKSPFRTPPERAGPAPES